MQRKKLVYQVFILLLIVTVPFLLSSFKKEKKTTVNVTVVYDTMAYRANSDTITYKNNTTLQWNDFKGSVPSNSKAAANSAVGFKFDVQAEGDDETLNLKVTVAAFFVRSKSWSKVQHASDYILKHEQGHFDLARVGVSMLKKQVEQQKYTEKNYNRLLEKAYESAWNDYLQLQEDYDAETNHSIVKEAQEKWNKKIAQLLLLCN